MSLYAKKRHTGDTTMKFGSVNQKFMVRAEQLLFGELAVALGIRREEVQDYIASRVGDWKPPDRAARGSAAPADAASGLHYRGSINQHARVVPPSKPQSGRLKQCGVLGIASESVNPQRMRCPHVQWSNSATWPPSWSSTLGHRCPVSSVRPTGA